MTTSQATSQAAQGQQWLETLLSLSGFPATVKDELPETQAIDGPWLTINEADLTAEQANLLLANDAQILDAMQYLLNVTQNLGQDKDAQTAFTVELAGFRFKRLQELQALADQVAASVRESGTEQEMPPLSAAERRLVHTLFKSVPDLETYSRGQEPDRRLVVRIQQSEPESADP
jgi:spoIIIJ-associated protein